MKYVDTVRKTRNGGSCSNCETDYVASEVSQFHPNTPTGVRIHAKFDGIVEPFNLCYECYQKIKKDGEI